MPLATMRQRSGDLSPISHLEQSVTDQNMRFRRGTMCTWLRGESEHKAGSSSVEMLPLTSVCLHAHSAAAQTTTCSRMVRGFRRSEGARSRCAHVAVDRGGDDAEGAHGAGLPRPQLQEPQR